MEKEQLEQAKQIELLLAYGYKNIKLPLMADFIDPYEVIKTGGLGLDNYMNFSIYDNDFKSMIEKFITEYNELCSKKRAELEEEFKNL